jgi:hypothetical protein
MSHGSQEVVLIWGGIFVWFLRFQFRQNIRRNREGICHKSQTMEEKKKPQKDGWNHEWYSTTASQDDQKNTLWRLRRCEGVGMYDGKSLGTIGADWRLEGDGTYTRT